MSQLKCYINSGLEQLKRQASGWIFRIYRYTIIYEQCCEMQSLGLTTRSDTNQAMQSQTRGLKYLNKEEDGLYYLFSVTKMLISCAYTMQLGSLVVESMTLEREVWDSIPTSAVLCP